MTGFPTASSHCLTSEQRGPKLYMSTQKRGEGGRREEKEGKKKKRKKRERKEGKKEERRKKKRKKGKGKRIFK